MESKRDVNGSKPKKKHQESSKQSKQAGNMFSEQPTAVRGKFESSIKEIPSRFDGTLKASPKKPKATSNRENYIKITENA